MLEGVLAPGGTASEVSVPGYTLAGKTGTAEKVVDGVYSKTKFVASFVGFAPAENPQLLVSVAVDEPQGDYYGGTVAAPAFGEIAEFALPYLGIEVGCQRTAEPAAGLHRIAGDGAPRGPRRRFGRRVDRRSRRRGDRPRIRQPRCPGGNALLLRPRRPQPTATTSRPARSRRAPARWWSSARSSWRSRRRSWPTRGRRWHLPRWRSSAIRPPSSGSPGSPAPTARPPPRSSSATCSSRPGPPPGSWGP